MGLPNRGGGKPGLAEDTLQALRHYPPRSPEAWLYWSCPHMPSPEGQYIFCRLGRMASLMKEKTTRMPRRLPRLPLVK